jgi:regulator of cell morphogenesis and NO signaling
LRAIGDFMTTVMDASVPRRHHRRSQEGDPVTTAVAPQVIDVRTLRGPNRCQIVLAAFDSLAPGESLVAVSDHRPQKLLGYLQTDRKGKFEWSPLEAGPERFRTQVTRRDAPLGAGRGISEALAWDHDRLDGLEQRTFELFATGDVAGAGATWTEFSFGLRRHIGFEEEILFPAFEEKVGLPPNAGPTAVMRQEHREIERLIAAIGRALAGEGAPLPFRSDLHRVLGQHNEKEERVLYPGADQLLSAEERDAVVARIQAS